MQDRLVEREQPHAMTLSLAKTLRSSLMSAWPLILCLAILVTLSLLSLALAAHWLADNPEGSEAYYVRLSFSHDGGKTWASRQLVGRRGNDSTFAGCGEVRDGKRSAVI
jgi:hypothetical protein